MYISCMMLNVKCEEICNAFIADNDDSTFIGLSKPNFIDNTISISNIDVNNAIGRDIIYVEVDVNFGDGNGDNYDIFDVVKLDQVFNWMDNK